eukprot:Amastigsp_a496_78.p3 type:complete len:146 gc:universal Amastigsp_a496_78:460-23(-)
MEPSGFDCSHVVAERGEHHAFVGPNDHDHPEKHNHRDPEADGAHDNERSRRGRLALGRRAASADYQHEEKREQERKVHKEALRSGVRRRKVLIVDHGRVVVKHLERRAGLLRSGEHGDAFRVTDAADGASARRRHFGERSLQSNL